MNKIIKLKAAASRIVLSFIIIIILACALMPMAVILTVSLKEMKDIFHIPATWLPRPIVWSNYITVLEQIPIAKLFLNSLKVTSLSVILTMLIAIPAAYGFSRLDFYGKNILYYITLASQILAPIIVLIPIFQTMSKIGLLDTHLSLILTNVTFNLAFITLMLKASFDGVPDEVIQAAEIDGCGQLRVMISILLPVVSTGLVVAVIYAFTRSWNEFLFTYIFISSDAKELIIVKLYKILKANPSTNITWNTLMAGSVYSTVPLIVLFLSIKKHIVKGMVTGAIK